MCYGRAQSDTHTMDYNTGRYRKATKVWVALQKLVLNDEKRAKFARYNAELEEAYSALSTNQASEQKFAAACGRFGIYYIPKRKNTIFSKPSVENYPPQNFGREDDGLPINKSIEFRFGGNSSANRPSRIFKFDELVAARQIVYDFRNSEEGGKTWGMKVGYTSRCWYEDVYCVLNGITKPGVPIWTGNPSIGRWYRKYTGRDWVTGFAV